MQVRTCLGLRQALWEISHAALGTASQHNVITLCLNRHGAVTLGPWKCSALCSDSGISILLLMSDIIAPQNKVWRNTWEPSRLVCGVSGTPFCFVLRTASVSGSGGLADGIWARDTPLCGYANRSQIAGYVLCSSLSLLLLQHQCQGRLECTDLYSVVMQIVCKLWALPSAAARRCLCFGASSGVRALLGVRAFIRAQELSSPGSEDNPFLTNKETIHLKITANKTPVCDNKEDSLLISPASSTLQTPIHNASEDTNLLIL